MDKPKESLREAKEKKWTIVMLVLAASSFVTMEILARSEQPSPFFMFHIHYIPEVIFLFCLGFLFRCWNFPKLVVIFMFLLPTIVMCLEIYTIEPNLILDGLGVSMLIGSFFLMGYYFASNFASK